MFGICFSFSFSIWCSSNAIASTILSFIRTNNTTRKRKRTQTVVTSLVHPSNYHKVPIALFVDTPHQNERIENYRRIKIAFCELRSCVGCVCVFENEKIDIYFIGVILPISLHCFFLSQLVYFLFMDVVFVIIYPWFNLNAYLAIIISQTHIQGYIQMSKVHGL